MSRNSSLDVRDILQNMTDAEEFIQGLSSDEFAVDKKTFNAVVRAREVTGEAAKNGPAPVRGQSPLCPGTRWRRCATRSFSF